MKLDLKLLIGTAVAGLASFVVNQILYTALVETMPRPVVIGILVAVFAAICCIVISVVVKVCDQTQDEFLFLESRAWICVGLAVCLLVLFLATMLFEWIYDHETIQASSASSYIFILDESGSMSGNDPDYERYSAVDSVVQSMTGDFSYAVYMFSDGCVRIRDMLPASAGKVYRPADADETMMGGTCIKNALEWVYDDIQGGVLGDVKHTQVILLTDGYASDMGWIFGKGILKSYSRAKIPVSTVGLGNVDTSLMTEIAEKTGGLFVNVTEASQLAQGFSSVAYLEAQRDLVSSRNIAEKDGLYLFLRILFLTLIGAAVAFMKAMAVADYDSTAVVLIEGAAAGLVGALFMEFGLALALPTFLCRLIFWMLLAVTPRMVEEWIPRADYGTRVIVHGDSPFNKGKTGGSGTKKTRAGQVDWG